MTLSDPVREFIDAQLVGVLATRSAGGRVHQSLVHYAREGDRLLVTTEARRHKARDVQDNGWASLCVMGHERPYPSATLAGPATILTEGIGARTAAIAQRVMGLDAPPEPQPEGALREAGRVLLVIEVQRVGPTTYLAAV